MALDSSSLILALDTSTSVGVVGLVRNDRLLGQIDWRREGSHGEFLTSAIETCLQQASLTVKDLNAVAVGVGPGSFTGARIAVNAARSLAFALQIPILIFNTAELLAAGCLRRDLPIVAMIDAQKNQVFAAIFVVGQQTLAPQTATAEELEVLLTGPHLCVGDGFEVLNDTLSESLRTRLVRDSSVKDEPQIAALARLSLHEREPLGWKAVQALYIKASGAEEQMREDLGKKV